MKNTNSKISNKNLHQGSFTSKLYGMFRFRCFNYDQIDAMISRNRGQSMVGIFLRLIPAMLGVLSKSIPTTLKVLLYRISKLHHDQGKPGMVKYLKAASVLLQQSICGYKVSSFSPRVSRTNSGIPRILPIGVRRLIRKGNTFYMKLSLTVFSVFRDLHYDTLPNLSSITLPFTGKIKYVNLVIQFIPRFVELFCKGIDPRKSLGGEFKYFSILKSSPQVPNFRNWPFNSMASTNPVVLVRSLLALSLKQIKAMLALHEAVLPQPKKKSDLNFGSNIHFGRFARKEVSETVIINSKTFSFPELLVSSYSFFHSDRIKSILSGLKAFQMKNLYTGKLGLKQEAAGKMRVFAMVDPWTQWTLYPFHKVLFRILSKHHLIDGTFNQLRPLNRAFIGNKPLFSMDLSSATDRLPISIQIPLFKAIFRLNSEQAEAWKELMVGRAYLDPNSKVSIYYAVGQPMGALSSWAMLAMTHHLIVQVAAWSCGYSSTRLFKDYALLGDDIVIYNAKVSKKYHEIMTGLGVECNLAKSIMSPKGLGLEFAKKTIYKGIDVSPVPLKEYYSALQGILPLIEFGRKYSLSFVKLLSVAGFGYKVKGSCNQPLHKLSFKVRYLYLSMMIMDAANLSKTIKSLYKKSPSMLHTILVTKEWVYTLLSEFQNSLIRQKASVMKVDIDLFRRFILDGKTSFGKADTRVFSLVSVDAYRDLKPKLEQYFTLLMVSSQWDLMKSLEKIHRSSRDLLLEISRSTDNSMETLMSFFNRYIGLEQEVKKVQPELFLKTPNAQRGLVRLPQARPGVLRRYIQMETWQRALNHVQIRSRTIGVDSSINSEVPAQESGFHLLIVMLRSLFFTTRRAGGLFLGPARSLMFRRYILPNLASFGFRTVLWIWIGEMLFTLILSTIISFFCWLIWILFQWLSGEGTMWNIFITALPFPLSGLPSLSKFTIWFYNFIGASTIAPSNPWQWWQLCSFGLLIHMNIMLFHLWDLVREMTIALPVDTWAQWFGLHIGLIHLLIIDPIMQIFTYCATWPSHRGTGNLLHGNLLVITYREIFGYLMSECSVIYSVLINGIHPNMLHDCNFSETELLLGETDIVVNNLTDPWVEHPQAAIVNELNDPSDLWVVIDNVEEIPQLPAPWQYRLKWLIITKPALFGMACMVTSTIAYQIGGHLVSMVTT